MRILILASSVFLFSTLFRFFRFYQFRVCCQKMRRFRDLDIYCYDRTSVEAVSAAKNARCVSQSARRVDQKELLRCLSLRILKLPSCSLYNNAWLVTKSAQLFYQIFAFTQLWVVIFVNSTVRELSNNWSWN